MSIISSGMAKTEEQLAELLKLVRDEDLATLRALERQLRALVEDKERGEAARKRADTEHDLSSKQVFNVTIDPDLLALVGIHPENPVQEDQALIRDIIARRLTD